MSRIEEIRRRASEAAKAMYLYHVARTSLAEAPRDHHSPLDDIKTLFSELDRQAKELTEQRELSLLGTEREARLMARVEELGRELALLRSTHDANLVRWEVVDGEFRTTREAQLRKELADSQAQVAQLRAALEKVKSYCEGGDACAADDDSPCHIWEHEIARRALAETPAPPVAEAVKVMHGAVMDASQELCLAPGKCNCSLAKTLSHPAVRAALRDLGVES